MNTKLIILFIILISSLIISLKLSETQIDNFYLSKIYNYKTIKEQFQSSYSTTSTLNTSNDRNYLYNLLNSGLSNLNVNTSSTRGSGVSSNTSSTRGSGVSSNTSSTRGSGVSSNTSSTRGTSASTNTTAMTNYQNTLNCIEKCKYNSDCIKKSNCYNQQTTQTQKPNITSSNTSNNSSNSTSGHHIYNVYIDVDANNNKISGTGKIESDDTQITNKPKPKPTIKPDCDGKIFKSKEKSLTDKYDYVMVDDYKWMIPRQYYTDNKSCQDSKKNKSKPSARLTSGVPTLAFEYAKYGSKIPKQNFPTNYKNTVYP